LYANVQYNPSSDTTFSKNSCVSIIYSKAG
jgi:hypothetical protein